MRTQQSLPWISFTLIVVVGMSMVNSLASSSSASTQFLQRIDDATFKLLYGESHQQSAEDSEFNSLLVDSSPILDDGNNERESPLRRLDGDGISERLLGFVPRSPPEGSLFTWDSIVDEPHDTVFNETFANLIDDYNNPDECKMERWHVDTLVYMEQVMQFWSELAERERIPYLLGFGSLLGYARNKNYTPYDADMDILVPSWAYDRLAKYSTPLPIDPKYAREKFLLQLHPEFRHVALNQRRRYSCGGAVTEYYEGLCSFAGNMGRLSLKHRHLDLFAMDHLPQHKIAIVSKDHVVVAQPEVFFPPRPCTFFGVKLFCPNDYVKAIRSWYGKTTESLRPSKLCIDGQWQTSRDNPQAHATLLKEWKERVGPVAADDADDIEGVWVHKKVEDFCSGLKPKMDPMENGICNMYIPKVRQA